MKQKQDAKLMWKSDRKVSLALQDQVKKRLTELEDQGIEEPVELGGVINASHVVLRRKKDASFRLCADYKVHVNDKIMTEAYSLPGTEISELE